jgi:hypothetical protein
MKATRVANRPPPEIEVYQGFMRFGREHRRRIAVRILRNQKVLADLCDHFLFQRSLEERGPNLAWEPYGAVSVH